MWRFPRSEPDESRVVGMIPAGWYPAAIRIAGDSKTVYILNSKGGQGKPNPKSESIGSLLNGTVQFVPMPDSAALRQYTLRTRRLAPFREKFLTRAEVGRQKAVPARPGGKLPIRYVVYVIMENRTCDQVFGGMKAGNGDPSLCIFNERVTPNRHALAKEFVLLDNFSVDSEVSADGHNWSTAAYATDYVEKMWPYGYGGHDYDYEGTNPITYPDAGFNWGA
ncbi:MAG: hypothetical protein IT210_01545 [Armatimonadetes bacterium]|nr:hypothetical protein [Armatimonadota bacterium]